MRPTGYRGITTLSKALPYFGGCCKFWYCKKEDVESWGEILPATQGYATEPILKEGKKWYGPVEIPDDDLGWEEPQERSRVGIFYKQKIEGFYPGDDQSSRVNLDNMAYHQFVIVMKQRAGGMFLILGNDDAGLDFDNNFSSGKGGNSGTAGSKISFIGESIYKALALGAFAPDNTVPPPDYDGGDAGDPGSGGSGGSAGSGGSGTNQFEIIEFENEDEVTIIWDDEKKEKFGLFPTIEVWFTDEGPNPQLVSVPITVDQAPPDTTLFTISNTGDATGFIVIK